MSSYAQKPTTQVEILEYFMKNRPYLNLIEGRYDIDQRTIPGPVARSNGINSITTYRMIFWIYYDKSRGEYITFKEEEDGSLRELGFKISQLSSGLYFISINGKNNTFSNPNSFEIYDDSRPQNAIVETKFLKSYPLPDMYAKVSKSSTGSNIVIQMEYDNGIYRIPCTVNGANMKMVFDTGASTVSLSLATALHLFQNGFINKNDFKGTGQSSTASGDIVDHMIINLRDIELGGMHLYNVEGVVVESLTAPLLLGQSAIQKLGLITIDGSKLIINSRNSNVSSSYSNNNPYTLTPPSTQNKLSTTQYFKYNGYLLDRYAFVQRLQMDFDDYYKYRDVSSKQLHIIAETLSEIIEFIRKGECYFELNSLHFYNGYGNLKRSKKQLQCVQFTVGYVGHTAKQMVKEGNYKK